MSRLERYLLQLTIFLIPTNLAYHWYISQAYVNGSLVDYLLPKLYLSDLPILALLIIWMYRLHQESKIKNLKSAIRNLPAPRSLGEEGSSIILLFIYLLITSLLAPRPLPALWYWLKLLELSLFGFYLWQPSLHKQLPNLIRPSLLLALAFQSIIGLTQYIKQSSIIGYLFFGETNLINTSAVAKDAFSGALKILSYGTTPHPNVLAGFLAVCVLYLITNPQHFPKNSRIYITEIFFICLGIVVLYLTQSQAATYTLFFLIAVNFYWQQVKKKAKYKNVSLVKFSIYCLIVIIGLVNYHSISSFDNTSIDRRYRLFSSSFKAFESHPIFGVGLNQSIPIASSYGLITTPAPFLQPVHNIYFLWLVETGIVGTLLLAWIIYNHRSVLRKRLFTPQALPFIFLLIIGLVDHYPLTLQTGQLLLLLTFSQTTPTSD